MAMITDGLASEGAPERRDIDAQPATGLDSLEVGFRDLLVGLRQLWQIGAFLPHGVWISGVGRLSTAVGPAPVRLPKTGRPIRGMGGTSVETHTPLGSNDLTPHFLVFSSTQNPGLWAPKDLDAVRVAEQQIQPALQLIMRCLRNAESLSLRIAESAGYKHFEPTQLPDHARTEEFVIGWFLPALIGRCLVEHGFLCSERATFDAWVAVHAEIMERLKRLEGRRHNCYRVIALLNGPSVDEEAPVAIGETTTVGDVRAPIYVSYATDSLLGRLDCSNEFIRAVNTAISFECRVPVDATVALYESVYVHATYEVQRVLDVLRLVRSEDIGVELLAVVPSEEFTPAIRPTRNREFGGAAGRELPRRFTFGPPFDVPLSDLEISKLKLLLARCSTDVATGYIGAALRRFRLCYDAYEPNDPERMLDLGIALECLYLREENSQELAFRRTRPAEPSVFAVAARRACRA